MQVSRKSRSVRNVANEKVFERFGVFRQQPSWIEPVAPGRGIAAVLEPVFDQVRLTAQRAQHHLLMITFQDIELGKLRRPLSQEMDDVTALRATINEIAREHDETRHRRAGLTILADQFEHRAHFVVTAIDIADGIESAPGARLRGLSARGYLAQPRRAASFLKKTSASVPQSQTDMCGTVTPISVISQTRKWLSHVFTSLPPILLSILLG